MTNIRAIGILAWCWLAVAPLLAQDATTPRQWHPWGRFSAGSWKHMRILTEQYDEKGEHAGTTTTETTTTLEKISDQTVTLRLEASVELGGGRRIDRDKQTVTQGFFGEQAGQSATSRRTGDAEVTIGSRTLATESHEILVTAAGLRRSSIVNLNSKSFPYVLKRVTTESEGEAKPAVTTTVDVIALEMPFRVLDEICPVALVRTVESRPDGAAATSYEAQCLDVPGWTVWQSSKVTSPSGKVVRRTVLELLDYQVEGPASGETAQNGRRRRFHRTRPASSSVPEKSRRE